MAWWQWYLLTHMVVGLLLIELGLHAERRGGERVTVSIMLWVYATWPLLGLYIRQKIKGSNR